MQIHSINYIIGILAAIAIGIDCAITAFVYMSLAGGFYVFAPLMIACCIATFTLNSILYFQDIPEAFQKLHNDIGIPSLAALKPIKFLVNTVLYSISIASAVTIGAFTYYSYLLLPPTIIVVPHALIIVFCIAYMIGTFAILKSALDNLIKNDDTTTNEEQPYNFGKLYGKICTIPKNTLPFFLALTTATIVGCTLTLMTVLKGLTAATLLLAPSLSWAVMPLFILFLLAELAFTVNTMLFLFNKAWNLEFNWKTVLTAVIAIGLNSTCNAAITKDATKQFTLIVQFLGFSLSSSVMTKAISEFISDFWNGEDTQWPNVYNALYFVEHLVVMSLAIFFITTVLMPLIVPSTGVLGAFLAAFCIVTVILMIDQAIDIHFSNFGAQKKAGPTVQNEGQVKGEHLNKNKASESNANRTPLIIAVMPYIGEIYTQFQSSRNTA
tara:strand:+ start:434 stop:1750 length:1317 start_codon:yes stop_codon:yes gene_type:complete